ncbi:hypothetical protein FACS1894217_11120 [Clostridia bacterium]|nr:hypothetical protein FACS1894217_11120 [Clostridia bacterium]
MWLGGTSEGGGIHCNIRLQCFLIQMYLTVKVVIADPTNQNTIADIIKEKIEDIQPFIDGEETKIEILREIQFKISLDPHTRVARRIIPDNPFIEAINETLFKCPYCDSTIQFYDLADNLQCEASYERNMGTENQYSLCAALYLS